MYFEKLPKDIFELLISFFTKFEDYLILRELFSEDVKNYIKCIEELDDPIRFPNIQRIDNIIIKSRESLIKLNFLKKLKSVNIVLSLPKKSPLIIESCITLKDLGELIKGNIIIDLYQTNEKSKFKYQFFKRIGNKLHLAHSQKSWLFEFHKLGINEVYLYNIFLSDKANESTKRFPCITFNKIHLMFKNHIIMIYEIIYMLSTSNIRAKTIIVNFEEDTVSEKQLSNYISQVDKVYTFEKIKFNFNQYDLEKIIDKFPNVKKFYVRYESGEKFETLRDKRIIWV